MTLAAQRQFAGVTLPSPSEASGSCAIPGGVTNGGTPSARGGARLGAHLGGSSAHGCCPPSTLPETRPTNPCPVGIQPIGSLGTSTHDCQLLPNQTWLGVRPMLSAGSVQRGGPPRRPECHHGPGPVPAHGGRSSDRLRHSSGWRQLSGHQLASGLLYPGGRSGPGPAECRYPGPGGGDGARTG